MTYSIINISINRTTNDNYGITQDPVYNIYITIIAVEFANLYDCVKEKECLASQLTVLGWSLLWSRENVKHVTFSKFGSWSVKETY